MAIGVACLVPLGAGLLGIAQGASMRGQASEVGLDSHIRYLSGLLLGIGLGFASTVPAIERHSDRFAILAAIVIIGGLARLCGVLTYIRGKPGVVVSESPAYPFPDAHAHGVSAADEPTYDVAFRTEDLWPNSADSADSALVHVGVFRNHLDRAD